MTGEISENLKIRKYLLGMLENGREQIEERLMTDDGYFQTLLIEEEELIRDYVDENLSPEEAGCFENHFLISEERQKKLNFALALNRKLNESLLENKFEEKELQKKISLLAAVQGYFSNYLPKPALLFLLITILGGIIGVAVFYSGGSQLSSLEKEFVEINKTDFGEIGKYSEFSRLNLLAGDTRSLSNIQSIFKQKLTDRVFFRLDLPFHVNKDEKFSLELTNSKKVAFSQNQLRSYENSNGFELRFLLPSSILEKGENKIKIVSNKNNEAVYLFFVE